MLQHKEKTYQLSFSTKYNLNLLVYYEAFQEIGDAIGREKQLKSGSRQKKVDLINCFIPDWDNLYLRACGEFSKSNLPF